MAEETVSLNGEDEATIQLAVCVLCATDLKDKSPKLLSCLHSLCENCLNSLFQLQVQQTNEPENQEQNNEKNGKSVCIIKKRMIHIHLRIGFCVVCVWVSRRRPERPDKSTIFLS